MRWLALLGVWLAPLMAAANGRNPHTVGIYFRPGEPQTIYVATTFGLLVSTDEGCAFNWMCEQSIGYAGTWDPQYAVATDGTIFATTFDGLRISRDGGCTFSTASSTNGLWIDTLAMGPTGEVWIGTAETAGINDVLRSTNNGMTFESRGMQSAETWWKSVRVAPSNAQRVYITGYKVAGTPTAYFYSTDDAGTSWVPSPLTDVMYGATPVLRAHAVDPANPDVVYMTSEAANPPAGDRLYRSTDAGQSWTEVLATGALVHDVVIRGSRVFVATQVKTSTSIAGGPSYVSSDGGMTFEPMAGVPQLACLASAPDGSLVGCGANWEPDFKAVARSTDDGATWDKVWRFVELNDAVQCESGTVQHDTCDVMLWDCPSCGTDLKRQFTVRGPSCGAGAAEPVPKKNGSGCCGAGDPVGMLGALGLLALRRRRRAAPASSGS